MAIVGGRKALFVAAVAASAALSPLLAVVPPLPPAVAADAPTPGGFTALTPARILDTRTGLGAPSAAPIGPGGVLTLQATGRGGIPASGVEAVALNVAVTQPSAGGYLTLYPAGVTRPLASNLNFGPGQTLSNAVVVKVGTGGAVNVFNQAGTSHVVVDVSGWYSTSRAVGSAFTPLVPTRVLDTRQGGTPIGPNASIHLDLSDGPPAVTGVAVNVTVTQPTAAGFLTLWPTGAPRPFAANLNFVPGQTRGNLAAVAFGAGGIDIFNSGGTSHVVVDLLGYWGGLAGGGRFTGVTPTRILDTRTGQGQPAGAAPIGHAGTIDVAVTGVAGVPAQASAVIMNVTATQPTAGGYFTVFPTGEDQPFASNLNFGVNETVPNLVIVPVGDGGKVTIFNQAGQTHAVADIVGWFDQPVLHLAAGGVKDTGGVPPDVVIDPTSTFAYISNPPLNRVEVLRLSTGTLEAPIPVGSSPSGLDLTPAGDLLYVADRGSSFVSVVNVATRTELRRIAVPSGFSADTPYSIAVLANRKALLTTTFNGTGFGAEMYEINLDTDAVVNRNDFSVGATTERTMIRASADRQSAVIVVGDSSAGPIVRYDAPTNTFSPETTTAGFRGNVGTNANGSVSVLNPGGLVFDRALRLTGSVPACGSAGVVLNGPGTTAWALGNGEIAVCDLVRFLVVDSVPIGDAVTHGGSNGNRLARSPDGSTLVGITDSGVVLARL
jgi:YVTN family beta-propeller protein